MVTIVAVCSNGLTCKWAILTFHNIEIGPCVAFLDDDGPLLVVDTVHGLHNLIHLTQVELLQEVIVQERLLDQLLRSEREN